VVVLESSERVPKKNGKGQKTKYLKMRVRAGFRERAQTLGWGQKMGKNAVEREFSC
jgi:hypothetical protein